MEHPCIQILIKRTFIAVGGIKQSSLKAIQATTFIVDGQDSDINVYRKYVTFFFHDVA